MALWKSLCTSLTLFNCLYVPPAKLFYLIYHHSLLFFDPDWNIVRWIFYVEANLYTMQGNTGIIAYISILKHCCDRNYEKHANTRAYWLQFPSQPLCKIERHGHHHADIWMSSHLVIHTGRSWTKLTICFLSVSSKYNTCMDEHHAFV